MTYETLLQRIDNEIYDKMAWPLDASSAVSETVTAHHDAWTYLNYEYIDSGSVVVQSSGGTTYTEGTDYEIDYENGYLYTDSSGSIPDSSVLIVDFSTGMDYRLDFIHRAVLTIGATIPLQSLSEWFTFKESTDSEELQANGQTYYKVKFPPDIFVERADMGVEYIVRSSDYLKLEQMLPWTSFIESITNPMHDGEVFVAISWEGGFVFNNSVSRIGFVYVPRPVKPTVSDYDSKDVPLQSTDLQRVVSLAAAHLNGVQSRDTAASQFEFMLDSAYNVYQTIQRNSQSE